MSGVGQTRSAEQGPGMMRLPWGIILAVLTLVFASIAVLWLHPRQTPTVGGPFELVDARSGRPVSDRDFRGKWLVVFFGYTHCPDVCPTTLSNIAAAMGQLGSLASDIQPVFITVDPERDTRQVLSDYTSSFDARIIGLTGNADQIATAAKAYQIYYAKRVVDDDYYMDHTSAVHVMRPDGSYAASLLSTADAADITKQLRRLMAGSRT
jgi:protein SCO1/2